MVLRGLLALGIATSAKCASLMVTLITTTSSLLL